MSAFFEAIHTAFNEAGIKPILVGGWAINLLGHARNTMDFDLMILETDVEKLHSYLEKAGFQLLFKNPELFAKYSYSHEKIFELDILFTDKTTYERLKSDSSEIKVGKIDCLLPSPMSIIAMKLHSIKNNFENRFPKDFPDIIALSDIHGIDMSSEPFKKHCLKFGNKKIYDLILNTRSLK
ncbi:MAG TPA: hypothetical protein DET40_19095 [Lentisphaeria bacterium]|nr:MAG: hypothetical protein A2X45_25270 [Lentisphaerae bacterium GWF2_50_93]HCE45654.1 hypothetical protein [Lentisphaeria bacterium]